METRSKINFLGSSPLIKILSYVICYLFLSLSFQSFADDGDDPLDDVESAPELSLNPIAREDIEHRLKPLGFGLMGDKIDTDKGAVVFNITDVSLPGNSELEVAIRRTTGGVSYTSRQNHFMADWILNIPSVNTYLPRGSNWINQRCSSKFGRGGGTSNGVEDGLGNNYYVYSWFDGVKLNIPGQGIKSIVSAFSSSGAEKESRWPSLTYDPSSGYLDPVSINRVTTDHWLITCGINATGDTGLTDSDGPGEGFIAISPEGTRYTFSRLTYFDAREFKHISAAPTPQVSIMKRHIASVMATKVEDIHGNWVKYDYDTGGKLTRIYANDDREIKITYKSGTRLIDTVTANNRVWRYFYEDHDSIYREWFLGTATTRKVLTRVELPDGLVWEYDLDDLTQNEPNIGQYPESDKSISVKHPSGVHAEYIVSDGHSEGVDGTFNADFQNPPIGLGPGESLYNRRLKTVTEKKLSGPSVPTSTWIYESSESGISEYDPSGRLTQYTYRDFQPEYGGADYVDGVGYLDCIRGTARKVISKARYDGLNGDLLEQISYEYDQANDFGTIPAGSGDSELSPSCEVYLTKQITTRGGDKYTTENTYNTDSESASYGYGKPLTTTSYSNISTDPRETVFTYENNKDSWVLGQTKRVVTNNREMSAYEYDWWGRKISESKFGGVPAKLDYHCSSNNLYSFTDPNGLKTLALDYYRGTPRQIERADGSSDEVLVDENGWIMAQKDFRGYWTHYDRDISGRITKIIPSKIQKNWLDTNISYDFGDEITQTVTRGDREEVITYDNFQRVILQKLQDLDGGDTIYTRTKYNESGEESFKSFPSFDSDETRGMEKEYDGLGRLAISQENVFPYALTSYDYLDKHRKDVTDPAGNVTSYYRSGYDGPDKGKLLKIDQPMDVTTQFSRNVWDQLTRIRQDGTQNGLYTNQYRYFIYDDQQRLCLKYRREAGGSPTGSVLYEYDAAGNMVAYQEGARYKAACSELSDDTKVSLELDKLYRVTRTNFADAATPDIYQDYDANGNVEYVNRDGVNWAYTYDELNHLTSEKLDIDGRNFDLTYTYNNAEEITYRVLPTGRKVEYEYDGLNRAVVVKDDDESYAQVHYHPNNLVRAIGFGNGNTSSILLNERLLVSRFDVENNVGDAEVSLNYEYDERGNVLRIGDNVNGDHDKSMGYDDLGRLNKSDGIWGAGTFGYDALGNLRTKNLGSRTVTINYNNYFNRAISSVDSVGGTRSIEYDDRGNVETLGDLDFAYDYSNQPVQISGSSDGSYKYDGNKKRVKAVVNGNVIYNVFDKSGKLVHIDAVTKNKVTDYIRLNGKTLARVSNNDPTYIHTDHLGSPLAGIDSSGQVIWRQDYTPYGEKHFRNSVNDDLGGFTGHISDSSTGLTYMQARYYDPVIGRFLSIDPVGFKASSPVSFNRYAYANNNPYKYVDPDGEFAMFAGNPSQATSPGSNAQSYAAAATNIAVATASNLNTVSNLSGHVSTAATGVAAASVVAGPGGVATVGTVSATVSTVADVISIATGAASDVISAGVVSNSTKSSAASTVATTAIGGVIDRVGKGSRAAQAISIGVDAVAAVVDVASEASTTTEEIEEEEQENTSGEDDGV